MRHTITAIVVISLCEPVLAAGFDQTLPADDVRQVTVAVASANLFVTGWKEKKLRIEADADPRVEVEGKNVRIGSFDVENPPETPEAVEEWHGKASAVTVRMPADAALTVRTLAGAVVVKALSGRAHLTVVSGDIRVEGCTGPVEVEAVSGDIRVVGLTADLSVKSVSGEVEIRGFKGLLLEAKSVSGSVTVRDSETRTARVSSHSGDVRYAAATAADGSVELTTFSGNAVVELPKGAGFDLKATTSSGSVSLDVEAEITERSERRMRARTPEPGPRFQLKSFSGDVTVR